MNKTIWMLAALLMSPLAWSKTNAPAEQKKMEAPKKVQVLGGPIVEIDKAKNIITLERKGKQYPIQLSKETSMRSGKETISAEKLTVGDRVNVNYIRSGENRDAISLDRYYSLNAKASKAEPAKEAKKPAPAKSMAAKPEPKTPIAEKKAEAKPAMAESKAPSAPKKEEAKAEGKKAEIKEAAKEPTPKNAQEKTVAAPAPAPKTPAKVEAKAEEKAAEKMEKATEMKAEKAQKTEAKTAKKMEKAAEKQVKKATEKPAQEVTSKEE